MSDVEEFYERARKHFPDAKPWAKLTAFEQVQVVQGINMILGVMTNE
jgi:hypothetical protein